MKLQFRGLKFLTAVALIYTVLLLFDTSNALMSFQSSAQTLYKILPIFAFIILLTAGINYFLKPQSIIKHLGKDSGKKGVMYSLIGGILSHGPIYVWYGVLSDMRKEGVKESLLITFLYARAIKLPLLPFMIDLFGLLFTVIMTLYILIFAVMQGMAMEYLAPKE